jgi:hypothetical protein
LYRSNPAPPSVEGSGHPPVVVGWIAAEVDKVETVCLVIAIVDYPQTVQIAHLEVILVWGVMAAADGR